MSCINSPFSKISKYLCKLLENLLGRSGTRGKNSRVLKDNIQNWVIMQGKILVSYDVESLYPSVPIKKAIDIILKLIEDRGGLRNITDLSLTSIKALMEFCLCNSYFEFEQTWVGLECGMIGLDLTGIVADIYMKDLS